MSVGVLLIFLNKLGKKIKCKALLSILSISPTSFINSIIQKHEYKILYNTLWTYSRSFQKWACIFTIFHAVVLLDSSN